MKADAPQTSRLLRGTKMPTLMFGSSTEASRHVALMIESLIRQNNSAGRPTVLGLPTGSTPVGLYRELIRLHREEGLDFSRVISFNLDEYYPMTAEDPQSYHAWMHENFFKHVNIRQENIHIPDGMTPPDKIEDYCAYYEQRIKRAGGIDIQVLGIGRTGHIGFNEPGSTRQSRTRLVTLDPVTRGDAASNFFGEENVPQQAITMGVGTILEARQIVIMAFGDHKAGIVRRTLEGEPTEAISASFLQEHDSATFILDEAAAAKLTAVEKPWRHGPVRWTPRLIRKAVLWLSLECKKPLLMLSNNDFRCHELHELLREHGPAQKLARRVFDEMAATVCDQPGGVKPCTALVFSPHPDDDVISMGGTMLHLVDQGHKVHVSYMTSGNIAVFDFDALRFVDFICEFNQRFEIGCDQTKDVIHRIRQFLQAKKPGQRDSEEVLFIKGLIRATEARAAALACGIPPEQLHFIDLPFYRTGTIAKAPIGPEDVRIVADLIEKVNPHQIYVAGELSDPHGTHRVCAEAIFRALKLLAEKGLKDYEVWLYRGAWQEWEPHEVDRVVPLSPDDMERKILAIFKHQSQKDKAMFPGSSDEREFWERAEQRNRKTAQVYDSFGLPCYYALEGFVRWQG
jgi:glucosamine-6-phosphate deaminase